MLRDGIPEKVRRTKRKMLWWLTKKGTKLSLLSSLTPNTKENKSTATRTSGSRAAPIQETCMREYTPAELTDIAANFQNKTRERAWLCGYRIRQETQKMNITTHPALWQHLHGVWRIQGTHNLIGWIILSGREAWSNEGDLPGHCIPENRYRKYNKFLGSWELDRQSIILYLKALIGPHSLQERKPRYSSPPPEPSLGLWYPCWTQIEDKIFVMLSNLLLILGKLTNPRKDLKQRGNSKGQKAIPIGCKESAKSNQEASVVWPHFCWDPTQKDKFCVGQLVENL